MKTVLITGGSRGIGKAMTELFSSFGYRVAFTYNKSEKEAEELALSTGALKIKADNSSEAQIVSAVSYAVEELGHIDVLINNAGISNFSLFTDLSLEDWNSVFAVNVTGAFLYSREVLRTMIGRKMGKIINISSVWGITGASCEVCYSASKAALIGMTKALAKEVGPSGITVNCIAPGVIETDMNKRLSREDIDALTDETPLMRIGTPLEIAKTALFLSESGGDFITGEVISVNGGFHI